MKFLVQDYLKQHGLSQLVSRYQLSTNEKDDLILLDYTIDTPVDELSKECRGIILQKDTWKIVSLPFKRFFNYHEGHAADIDWNSARACEKYDGSIISCFWYKANWRISTRGRIDADGNINGTDKTYAEEVFKLLPIDKLIKDYIYIFEFISPENRIVTDYSKPELVLLTMRNRAMDEVNNLFIKQMSMLYDVRVANSFPCTSLDMALEYVTELSNMKSNEEGIVVVDKYYNRIKVKNPFYLQLHRTWCNGKPDYYKMLLADQLTEFVSYFPNYKEIADKKTLTYTKLLSYLDAEWQNNKEAESKKIFAQDAAHCLGSNILFDLYDKKVSSAKEGFDRMVEHFKIKLLEKAEEFFEIFG